MIKGNMYINMDIELKLIQSQGIYVWFVVIYVMHSSLCLYQYHMTFIGLNGICTMFYFNFISLNDITCKSPTLKCSVFIISHWPANLNDSSFSPYFGFLIIWPKLELSCVLLTLHGHVAPMWYLIWIYQICKQDQLELWSTHSVMT